MINFSTAPLWYLLVLALIQGVTEALPVSSSAHLMAFFTLCGQENAFQHDLGAFLHLGSLGAFMVYFRQEVLHLFQGLFYALRGQWHHPYVRLLGNLILATLPSIAGGFILHIGNLQLGSGNSIYLISIIFGILLYGADRFFPQHLQGITTWRQALFLGLAEMLALVPGVSRLGICLTAGRALGVERTAATHFAFLMAIPTLAGAVVLEAPRFLKFLKTADPSFLFIPIVVFCTTLLCLQGFIKWIRQHTLFPFMVYRVILGLVSKLFH